MTALLLALAASAASIAAAPAPHRVAIDHRGTPVELVYAADVDIDTREIGMAPPNRADTRQCLWTVTVAVARHVEVTQGAQPTLRHGFNPEKVASGRRPGGCMLNRQAIAREAAAQHSKVDGHVREVAARDQSVVMAELDTMRVFASN